MTSKTTTKKQEQLAKLSTYSEGVSASKRMLMKNIKDQYENGTIQRITEAEGLMKLLRDNKMDTFDQRYAKLETRNNEKHNVVNRVQKLMAGMQKTPDKVESDDEVQITRRETSKDIVKVKHKRSELPTFELQFANVCKHFGDAWNAGVNKLIKIVVDRLKTKTNIKIVVGVVVDIVLPISDKTDEVETRTLRIHTTPDPACSEDGVAPIIKAKESPLATLMYDRIAHREGS